MKTFFFRNTKLKVIALLLAVVSWYAINEVISFETVLTDIPVTVKLSSGWAVLDQSDYSVDITVRGAQEDIRLIDNKQLKAEIDLSSDSVAGPVDASISPSDIKGIRAARVIRVSPDLIRVSLDKQAEKVVPVNSRVVGRPYYGEVEQVICEPAVVLIRGPARHLERTEWVSTEPIDAHNRVQSFTTRSHVLPPSDLLLYEIEPPDVLVHVMIAEKSESLEWENIPVQAIIPPGAKTRAGITPDRVTVRVTGRTETLGEVGDIVPRVFVDCVDLDPSLAYDLPVNVYLPGGLDLKAVADPAFVQVVMEQ